MKRVIVAVILLAVLFDSEYQSPKSYVSELTDEQIEVHEYLIRAQLVLYKSWDLCYRLAPRAGRDPNVECGQEPPKLFE